METPKKANHIEKQTYAFHRFTDYFLQAGKVKKVDKARGHSRDVRQIKTKLK